MLGFDLCGLISVVANDFSPLVQISSSVLSVELKEPEQIQRSSSADSLVWDGADLIWNPPVTEERRSNLSEIA